jgi:hypothetical protein
VCRPQFSGTGAVIDMREGCRDGVVRTFKTLGQNEPSYEHITMLSPSYIPI